MQRGKNGARNLAYVYAYFFYFFQPGRRPDHGRPQVMLMMLTVSSTLEDVSPAAGPSWPLSLCSYDVRLIAQDCKNCMH